MLHEEQRLQHSIANRPAANIVSRTLKGLIIKNQTDSLWIFSENLDYPVIFHDVVLEANQFHYFISGGINAEIFKYIRRGFEEMILKKVHKFHKKPLKSDVLACEWSQVYWDMPSCDTILSHPINRIYIMKRFITLQHFPERRTWIVTSWSKCSKMFK